MEIKRRRRNSRAVIIFIRDDVFFSLEILTRKNDKFLFERKKADKIYLY